MSKRDTPKEKSSSPCEVSVGSLRYYDGGAADIGRRFVASPPLKKEGHRSAASEVEMPMWIWIAIGMGSFLGLAFLVVFALARILGTIGRQVGELYEKEGWATLPPTRAAKDVEEQHPVEVEAKSSRGLSSVGHTSDR
jgi:hypothetical protein